MTTASVPQRTLPTPPPRTLADTLQLIALKSPAQLHALKVLAEMVLADLTSAEQSPH